MPRKVKTKLDLSVIPDSNDDLDGASRVVMLSKCLLADAILVKREIDIFNMPDGEKTRLYKRLDIAENGIGPKTIKALMLYHQHVVEYDRSGQLAPEGPSKYLNTIAKQLWFLYYHKVHDIPIDKRAKRYSLVEAQKLTGWNDEAILLYRRLMKELYIYLQRIEKIDY